MVLLDEQADDTHLDSAERLEERLESIDYDVWECPTCRYRIKVPYASWFSAYGECPSCKRRTLESERHTVAAATTLSEGQELIRKRCRNCGWSHTETRIIPRIVVAAATSGSGGSSGGGGSFGGGGGHSGGGSFGGGTSGGGGAGGRY